MSAKPIRLRLCDAIHEQFNGDIEPLQKILGIPEDDFEPFLRGTARLDEEHFERAMRWLFDYEGRVKPATPYANKVMNGPSTETYDSELSYEMVVDGVKRKSTEDLCQWIAQLEDQNKALKEELRLLKNKVGWAEEEVKDLREKFERIGSAFK